MSRMSKTRVPPAQRREDLKRLIVNTGRQHIVGYCIAFILLAVVSATTALTAWIMKDIVNDVFLNRNQAALFALSAAICVIYIVRGLAGFGQSAVLARIGNRIIGDIQKQMVRKVLADDVASVQARTSSQIANVFTMSAGAARTVLQSLVVVAGRDLMSLIGLLAVMIIQDPVMSAIVLVSVPIGAFGITRLNGLARKMARSQVDVIGRQNDLLRQSVQGFRTVKAFGMERLLAERMGEAIDVARAYANRIATVSAGAQPVMESVAGVAVGLAVFFGGWRVISGVETPGEFFSFVTALLLAYDPARRLAALRVQLETAFIGVRMMYEMLDAKPVIIDKPEAVVLPPGPGEIRFEKVNFGYQPNQPVLRDLDLVVPGGRTTAIIGLSGGGKSTIISLILRFWLPDSGRILVNGHDTRDLTAESLRAAIATVSQDTYLFDGTIRENILAGRLDADEEAMIAAAKAAKAHDFIMALDKGYDTPVGELASRLSGGQRQRICIARAFLRDASILILDEPTAALDAEAERSILDALAELAAGRTTIVIAHRLSSIVHSDKIVVLEHGEVIEEGDHLSLMARGGAYARLYRLQSEAPVRSAAE